MAPDFPLKHYMILSKIFEAYFKKSYFETSVNLLHSYFANFKYLNKPSYLLDNFFPLLFIYCKICVKSHEFPIKIESQISLLITYIYILTSLAIFIQ